MNPRVLVITPVYATEQNERLPLLLQTIYSVKMQAFPDFVHVIVDDGSTDETPEILDKMAKNEKMIVLHTSNKGHSSAINFGVEQGLKKFNADYVAVCHSDDIIPPRGLEARVSLADSSKVEMVYTDGAIFYENGLPPRLIRAREFPSSSELFQALLRQVYIPYFTTLWQRNLFEKIGGYDSEITSSEDWDISLRTAQELARNDKKHAVLHEVTAGYRRHRNNLGIQNVKDGTRWRCHKRIFAKHFSGASYYFHLAKDSLTLLKAFLPDGIERYVHYLKDSTLSAASPENQEFGFLESLRDYERGLELSSKPFNSQAI